MELRIGINNRRKQFTDIGRDNLCDFQDGVQYQFPYPVRGGQLESIPRGFTEEGSDSFVSLKPFYRAKYVVLHHGQREAGNLCREVYALTSAEVKQLLTIVISHLGSPAGSVRPVCFEETEREIRSEQSVPMPIPASLREEQAYGGTCKLHVDGAVGALQGPVVLGEALLLEFLDNLVGCQITPLGVVFGLSQFDHTNQMTLDVSAGNQADRLVMLSLGATSDLTQQLEVHRIQQLAPFDITIIHKTIEHVLLTTEQAA